MLRFKSITRRLIFLHILVIVVAAVVIPFVLFLFLDADVDRLQQNALRLQAEAVARNLSRTPDGKFTLELPQSLLHQYSEAYGRYAYAVLAPDGTVLFSSSQQKKPITKFEEQSSDVSYFEFANESENVIGVSLRTDVGGQTLFLQVAENLNHRDVLLDDVVRDYFVRAALVIAPILLALFLIDIMIFRRAMQPVVRASAEASQISPSRIGMRLTTKEIPSEIASLVAAVNEALGRLELGFRKQQEFAADAAHELRTPLAILRARVETLADKNAGAMLLAEIDSMTRTIGQLLDAAEIESIVINPNEIADLREICLEVAAFIAPLALIEKKTISLTGTENPVPVRGNSEMLRRAVRNIVENAIKHTPPRTAVDIHVGDNGVVAISDNGKGIAADELDRVFERRLRFNTGDTSPEGAGLGLSIVKRILDAHQGSISVESSAQTGTRFTMSLPLADPASVRL